MNKKNAADEIYIYAFVSHLPIFKTTENHYINESDKTLKLCDPNNINGFVSIIKIGKEGVDKKSLRELDHATSTPGSVWVYNSRELNKTFPAGTERILHYSLRKWRVRGTKEFFYYCQEVIDIFNEFIKDPDKFLKDHSKIGSIKQYSREDEIDIIVDQIINKYCKTDREKMTITSNNTLLETIRKNIEYMIGNTYIIPEYVVDLAMNDPIIEQLIKRQLSILTNKLIKFKSDKKAAKRVSIFGKEENKLKIAKELYSTLKLNIEIESNELREILKTISNNIGLSTYINLSNLSTFYEFEGGKRKGGKVEYKGKILNRPTMYVLKEEKIKL